MAGKKVIPLRVAYAGLRRYMFSDSKMYHEYVNVETNQEYTFDKKLFREHRVGYVYSIIPAGEKSYKLDRDNLQPIGKHKKSHDIAQWLKKDAEANSDVKAKRERAKLTSTARKAVTALRPMYKRAGYNQQLEMLRAIVDELESE